MKSKFSNQDFIVSMLPSNRKKQFFDLFKTRFSVISKIFLVSFLFSIPLFISFAIKYFFIIPNAALDIGVDTDQYIAFFKLTNIISYLVDIISLVILSIGYAGIFNIIKKISWGEPVFFFKHFKNGVKDNCLFFILLSLIFSFMRFAIYSFIILSGYHFISYIILFLFILILPISIICFSLNSIYEVSFFECLKKSMSYFYRKWNFLLLLIYPILILITKYFVEEYFGMAMLGFYLKFANLVFVLPIFVIISFLMCISVFDQYTNKTYFPEYYHKGLADSLLYKTDKYNRKNSFLLK